VIDRHGFDPRSSYVEMFWLCILGPTSTWLIRRLVAGLDDRPLGYAVDVHDLASSLGLGYQGGRHAPIARSLARLVTFEVARPMGEEFQVRRKLPPLARRQILRLPPTLTAAHDVWTVERRRTPADLAEQRRARAFALSLLAVDEDVEGAERQLLHWRFPAPLAFDAVAWAVAQRARAMHPSQSRPDPAA